MPPPLSPEAQKLFHDLRHGHGASAQRILAKHPDCAKERDGAGRGPFAHLALGLHEGSWSAESLWQETASFLCSCGADPFEAEDGIQPAASFFLDSAGSVVERYGQMLNGQWRHLLTSVNLWDGSEVAVQERVARAASFFLHGAKISRLPFPAKGKKHSLWDLAGAALIMDISKAPELAELALSRPEDLQGAYGSSLLGPLFDLAKDELPRFARFLEETELRRSVNPNPQGFSKPPLGL